MVPAGGVCAHPGTCSCIFGVCTALLKNYKKRSFSVCLPHEVFKILIDMMSEPLLMNQTPLLHVLRIILCITSQSVFFLSIFLWFYSHKTTEKIWRMIAAYMGRSTKNQQNNLCAQRRLWSAWASTQSDQESSLSTWRNLGSLGTQWMHSEDWLDWADAQADLSLHRAYRSFCWFCHALAHIILNSLPMFAWSLNALCRPHVHVFCLSPQKHVNYCLSTVLWSHDVILCCGYFVMSLKCHKYFSWVIPFEFWDTVNFTKVLQENWCRHKSKSPRTILRWRACPTVIFLSFRTDRSGLTVQTQIRLLLEEQSDQGLHSLRSSLIKVCTVCHSVWIVWAHYSMVEPHSSNFKSDYNKFLGVRIFRKFTVCHFLDWNLCGILILAGQIVVQRRQN